MRVSPILERPHLEVLAGENLTYTRNTLTPDCGLDDGLADRKSDDSGLGAQNSQRAQEYLARGMVLAPGRMDSLRG